MGTVFESGNDFGMAQQAFWGHDHERFTPGPKRLPAQTMKVLRGGGGIDDLKIVVGGKMKEAFQACAGVLGSLAFEAVRQEQDQPAEPLPFVLGAGDELVHDRLGGVPEI